MRAGSNNVKGYLGETLAEWQLAGILGGLLQCLPLLNRKSWVQYANAVGKEFK